MTATRLAQAAYGAASVPVRTDRDNELGAFEAITARLSRAAEPGAAIGLRASALHDNRRLWTALATDLAAAGNGLPDGLRAQLFYLAEFSLLQSRAALRDPRALVALIDVNRAVMRGLSGLADPT